MKTFSISAAIVASIVLGLIPALPKTSFTDVANVVSSKKLPKIGLTRTMSAPKSFLTKTYHGNGFHTYVETLIIGAYTNCTWYVADVPNQITIKDANGNTAYTLGWKGNANYYGPWGASISTSNTFYFGLNAGTYTVYVDTSTNVANGGSDDAWYIYY